MKTTESLELLAQGIKNLANRDNWIAYLKTQATFYTYSFNNVCLILQQCPHAVRVAGFHSWKKLDRSVKKGEKGIRILAPIVLKDPKNPDTIAGVSFKSASVFDISQTDGKPLPEVATKLLGDDRGLLEALTGFALGQGFTVKEEDLGAVNGCCSYQSPNGLPSATAIAIAINPNRSRLHQAKTLAHELGHASLHCGENYNGHDSKSAILILRDSVNELEAESVAFITLQHFGIDAGDYSFGYIAGWNADAADIEPAIAQLKQSGANIQTAADRIISGIEALLKPVSEGKLQT